MKWNNVPKDIDQYHGFVYRITNNQNGKMYIGKKGFWKKITRKPLKGNKNKRHDMIESDWKMYWGSSPNLIKDVEKYGEDKFTREMIHHCTSKFEMSYMELFEQIKDGVLFDDRYYNEMVNVRLRYRK